MPDVGDTATLTLTIDPADGTTLATVEATNPSTGATTSPSVTLDVADGVGTATALLSLPAAGAWQVTWTVTGQGAGVENDVVYAFGPITGKSYATLSELAAFLDSEPGATADRLLVKATRLIDLLTIGSVYDTDDDDLPTDATVAAAFRDAVCAQVAWWDEQGDTTGSGGATEWGDVMIGKVRLSRRVSQGAGGDATTVPNRLATEAVEILRVAGLLPTFPQVYG